MGRRVRKRNKIPSSIRRKVQKSLGIEANKLVKLVDVANIIAEKAGFPMIDSKDYGARDLAKHYILKYCREVYIPLTPDPNPWLAKHAIFTTPKTAKADWSWKPTTKAGDFYKSAGWRAVRYKALTTYGKKCMACGTTEGHMHVDHIKPRSKYPHLALELSNLQILCVACNFGKRERDETDWRPDDAT